MSRLRRPRCWSGRAAAQRPAGHRLDGDPGHGFTTLKWSPVAGATDYQIERTPVTPQTCRRRGVDRRPLAAAAHGHADLAVVRGVRLQARRPLPVARARAPRHREPAAVLGAGHRHDVGHWGRGAVDGLGEGATAATGPATRTRATSRRPTHGRAGRRERSHAGRRARAHAPEAAGEHVHHRLPEAARHGRGDLGDADVGDQLQRPRQRGRPAASPASRWRASWRSRTIRRSSTMLAKMTVLIVPSINPDGRAPTRAATRRARTSTAITR